MTRAPLHAWRVACLGVRRQKVTTPERGGVLEADDPKLENPADGGDAGDGAADVGAAGSDGGEGGGGGDPDASDAGSCAVDAPFTSVVRDDELSTDSPDYGVAFSPDARRAFVAKGALPDITIGVRVRSKTTEPFGPFIPLGGMPDGGSHWPTTSPDGTELFFSRNTGDVKIWRAVVASGAAESAAPVGELDGVAAEDHPYLANERVIYFTQNPSGAYAILRAERSDAFKPFGAPEAVKGLEAYYYAVKPVVTLDELTIYFGAASQSDGLNGTRIRRASRASVLDRFGASVEVTELRGANVLSGGDRPVWLSPDRCTLYFVSDRTTGVASDYDIWVAKRSP
jgi:hypothetical protein